MLREELQLLQEQGSYVGEVIKPMDKKKVLGNCSKFIRNPGFISIWSRKTKIRLNNEKVKIHPEGKFIVDIDPKIKIDDIKPNIRVALKSDSYVLHKILPNKVKFPNSKSCDDSWVIL